MTQRNDGGSAFPFEQITMREAGAPSKWTNHSGMSLRQYAAIKLRVPDSGTDWLDDMIRQSLRTDLAAKAMQAAATDTYICDLMASWRNAVALVSALNARRIWRC